MALENSQLVKTIRIIQRKDSPCSQEKPTSQFKKTIKKLRGKK